MKNTIWNRFRLALSILFLVISVMLVARLIPFSIENQRYKVDLAEINSVRYGLLNADEWKESLATVVTSKINEFQLTEENQDVLKTQVENLLYRLLDEVNTILKNDMGRIKRFLMEAFVDIDKLQENVPELAQTLLEEMEKPENKENLKTYLLGKLDTYVDDTFNRDEQIGLNNLLDKYGFKDKSKASAKLTEMVNHTWNQIQVYAWLVFIFLSLSYFLNVWGTYPVTRMRSTMMLAVVLLLVICGISMPMIDIVARISSLSFQMMGEEIRFTDQVLFFQSKSILDVVWILIENGKIEMIFVGILILGFSVMFPVMKVIATFLTIHFPKRFGSYAFMRFFTYKSGKWSMADVFVVAMFMAFVGFNGIISDQLSHLSNSSDKVDILTTNGTSLQAGFFFFLLFCIAGLFLSEFLQKKNPVN